MTMATVHYILTSTRVKSGVERILAKDETWGTCNLDACEVVELDSVLSLSETNAFRGFGAVGRLRLLGAVLGTPSQI